MSARLAALFLCSFLVSAATVPNRFIVELTTEPVSDHLLSGGAQRSLASAEATSHRARIQREQAQVKVSLQQKGAQVLESVDTIANAVLVQTTDANPEPWANLPNVLRVTPVRTVKMFLDRAVAVHKISNAWARLGGPANAGAGMKIAILDTGIDVGHAGFQNSPLALPAGFPLTNASSDQVYTNNKVIVARSYVSLLPNRDSDVSARDRVGHGTALAMISAGGTAVGPAATITGVASGAWLGSYKIFGTPDVNDESTDDAILKALDDAVKDGMDVINMSLGSDVAPRLGDDVEVQAIERATAAGVLVVVSAGNNGTNFSTVASPGTAPDAITVGAQLNDRVFAASVQVTGLTPFLALPGDGPAPAFPVSSSLLDIQSVDGTGLACNALPSGSLSNRIVLILRGTCTFEVKLKNAQNAGALAAVVYAAAASPSPIAMAVGTATLPAEMISYSDGVMLKEAIQQGAASYGTAVFTLSPVRVDPFRLTDFSSSGPNVDASIKPDLVAVGENFYVATQSFDVNGDMYSASGYALVDGTSFSSPTVAGAAALLKAARPGLTVAQYRSLLINSASPMNTGTVQQVGAGSLNADAAVSATAAMYPSSLSFGAGGAFPQGSLNLTVTNLGSEADTFTLRITPSGTGPAASVSADSVYLEPRASANIAVSLNGSNLLPGGYEGVVLVAAASKTGEARVPYWYGVQSNTPVAITDLDSLFTAARGTRQADAIQFRITDAAGLPITAVTPAVTVIAGGGTVTSIKAYDGDSPGLFSVSVRLGTAAGTNTFRVQAGDVIANFNITGK